MVSDVAVIGDLSSVVADVSVSGAYAQVQLVPADFGFSSAVVAAVGLPVDGYSLVFDPSTSVLSVVQVPAPILVQNLAAGAGSGVALSVPWWAPSSMDVVSAIYFPTAAGAPVNVAPNISVSSNSTQITLNVDTSSGSVLFTMKGSAGPGEQELDGSLVLDETVFRVIVWGF